MKKVGQRKALARRPVFCQRQNKRRAFLAVVIFRGIYLKVCIYTDIKNNKKVIFWKAKKKTKGPTMSFLKE